jgi:hypothetical protein
MILTAQDIDGNKKLVGKKIKLVKGGAGSDFEEGTIVTCLLLDENKYMRLGIDTDMQTKFAYSDEKWELVD